MSSFLAAGIKIADLISNLGTGLDGGYLARLSQICMWRVPDNDRILTCGVACYHPQDPPPSSQDPVVTGQITKGNISGGTRCCRSSKEAANDPVPGEAGGKGKASTCLEFEPGPQHPPKRILSCELDCDDMYSLPSPFAIAVTTILAKYTYLSDISVQMHFTHTLQKLRIGSILSLKTKNSRKEEECITSGAHSTFF